jgi:hypothetical protein
MDSMIGGVFIAAAGISRQVLSPGQCLRASPLTLSGRYNDLPDYVIFAVLLFCILTIAGLLGLPVYFIWRKKAPV